MLNAILLNAIIVHTQKKTKTTFCVILLIKLFVLIINLVKKVKLYRGKDAVNRFIKSILSEYNYYKKIARNCFKKNLIISAKEEERFELSNICWIV